MNAQEFLFKKYPEMAKRMDEGRSFGVEDTSFLMEEYARIRVDTVLKMINDAKIVIKSIADIPPTEITTTH